MYRYTFAVVDERALEHNVQCIRNHLSQETKLMIAVKANGYGHGVAHVVRAAEAGGADGFALASVEEAIELRKLGVTKPLLALGAITPPGLRAAALHGISVTYTNTWGDLSKLPTLPKPLSVHVKVDTGMNRLGLKDSDSVLQVVRCLSKRTDMSIDGLYTHLATADDPASPYTERQIERFRAVVARLEQEGYSIPLLHVANSGGALQHQDYQFNMVRVGISSYGYSPSPDAPVPVPLQPAFHMYALITRTCIVEPGEVIGYGATYTAKKRMNIATVPVGYGDGYPRVLSNVGYVVVRGQRAPIVGRICMDQFMIDITDIDGVKQGDAVTLFGRYAPEIWNHDAFDRIPEFEQADFIRKTFVDGTDGSRLLSLHEIAKLANTISYELMCAVSPRVPRINIPVCFDT